MGKHDISEYAVQRSLPLRKGPYWHIIEYGRHVGFQNDGVGKTQWVARTRTKSGSYKRQTLATVKGFHRGGIGFEDALAAAQEWFAREDIKRIASRAYQLGANQDLRYLKRVSGFTVGDAMRDYVEWKRIAASKSHFDAVLSLINHHIIPRIGDVLVEEFTSRQLTAFCKNVLETRPKRGNQVQGERIKLEDLTGEALRKRKKTANTLIGILRLAFRTAWGER